MWGPVPFADSWICVLSRLWRQRGPPVAPLPGGFSWLSHAASLCRFLRCQNFHLVPRVLRSPLALGDTTTLTTVVGIQVCQHLCPHPTCPEGAVLPEVAVTHAPRQSSPCVSGMHRRLERPGHSGPADRTSGQPTMSSDSARQAVATLQGPRTGRARPLPPEPTRRGSGHW